MKQQDLGLNLNKRHTRKALFLDEMDLVVLAARHHVEYLASASSGKRVLNTIPKDRSLLGDQSA